MSTSFRQIRKNSTAQGRFKDLIRDYQRFQAEQVQVDNPDFKVRLRTMYSKMVYQDPFFQHKSKPIQTQFYMPFEPDGRYCVAMYSLDHNGRFSIDASGSGHFGRWTVNPEVKEGIDAGFGTSLYADFDGEHTVMYVDNYPKLRLTQASYFSITGRIYPVDITASDGAAGTKYRTILCKTDSSDITAAHMGQIDSPTIGYGYHLAITPDAKLRFTLMIAGVKYTVETLPNIIVPEDPPLEYDFTLTVDLINKRTIPPEQILDPSQDPDAPDEEEPPVQTPLIAPRMELSVNHVFYALYTTAHLSFVDDGPWRRLRFGTAWSFSLGDPVRKFWYKFKGGIQQIRIYNGYILTFPQIEHLHENRMTVTDMPLGSPALAGSTYIMDTSVSMGFDDDGYDPDGFDTSSTELQTEGFHGMDPIGFDPTGFDTLHITEHGMMQDGGYDPRGFSPQGFHCIPDSQS